MDGSRGEILLPGFPDPGQPLPMHSPSDPLFSHLWNGYSDDYIIDSK